MERFQKKFGKLVERIAIPVDEKTKQLVDQVKTKGFDFNAWARDILCAHLPELEDVAKN